MNDVFLFFGGLVVALLGAEFLVRGASYLAKMLGISSLVVGLTVVGFGTSSPELAVSALASYQGEFELSLGNIIGSNIFNLLGILGMIAAIRPIKVNSQVVSLDLPVMLICTVLFWLLMQYGTIPIFWGPVLLALLAFYTIVLLRIEKEKVEKRPPFGWMAILISLAGIVAGLWMLLAGSEWLIQGALGIGKGFGISERVMGLTVVAIGTSIPEVATCLVALYRKQVDLAIGNIIGSNIYNVLAILSVSLLVSKGGVVVTDDSRSFDLLVLLGVSLLTYLWLKKGHHMSRKAGWFFIILYGLYIVWLVV